MQRGGRRVERALVHHREQRPHLVQGKLGQLGLHIY
jgi:hypothetical protein